jgi:hypothetical protein
VDHLRVFQQDVQAVEMVHRVAQRMPGTVAQLVGMCPGVIAVRELPGGGPGGRVERSIRATQASTFLSSLSNSRRCCLSASATPTPYGLPRAFSPGDATTPS